MPRVHYLQSAFNAGVLDPKLAARFDIRQYFQGMARGENAVCIPMGGVKRRPGLKHIDRFLRTLIPISSSSNISAITAPNGGTAGNANDFDPDTDLTTTTDVLSVDPYVVVRIDRGAALPASGQTVRVVDVRNIRSSDGSTDEFQIQYSTDDSTWVDFGEPFEVVDTEVRSYRRRGSSSARYWRLAKIGGSDMGTVTISIAEFTLWRESGFTATTGSRLLPFEFNTEQTYLLAMTSTNLAVYLDGARIADVAMPFSAPNAFDWDYAQRADTMILVTGSQRPQRLLRQVVPVDKTIGTAWQMDPVPFTNIPQFDFDDADSPTPTSEIQTLTFSNKGGGSTSWEEGDRFSLELAGSETGGITWAGDDNATKRAQTAENIRRELQKLPTVPGDTGISVAWTSGNLFTVTFADASAEEYDLLGAFPLSGSNNNKINVARTQVGSSRREDAWSDLRGWPKAVTFFGGRMWLGGTESLPTSFWGSTAFDLFDFKIGEGLPDQAIFNTLLGEQLNAIVALFAGRDLTMFTTGTEARFPGEVLTPENAIPTTQTRYGTAQIKPISIDGATLFMQRTRKVLRDFVYSQQEDAYLATPLTALAPFLVNQVQDMDGWQGSGDDDANLVLLVNGDGTIACLSTLRSQDVNAWTSWTTQGEFRSVGVVDQTIYVATRRETNQPEAGGIPPANIRDVFIEEAREDYFTDAAVQVEGLGGDTVTGLDHLDSFECRVRADGLVLKNQTPEDGEVTLEQEVDNVEVGLNFDVKLRTMPLNNDFGNGDNFLRKKRLVKARLMVFETLGVRFNGKRIPDRRMDESQMDAAPVPVTGAVEIEVTSNWSFQPLQPPIEVLDPVPFTLLGMDLQVETS